MSGDISRLHIAVTQVHTQPGVVDRLLKDTRECVEEILRSDNRTDTATVSTRPSAANRYVSNEIILFSFQAVIYGTNQKIPDKSLVCDMTKLYIRSWYDTNLDTSNVDNMIH